MKYARPASVAEAVKLLAAQPDSRAYAGATDLIPQMRMGRPEPAVLVDLKQIPRLMELRSENGQWIIGASLPAVRLTEHADLTAELPGLVESAGLIGSDQIQARASLGGNLCNASPAADSVPALVVNGARAVIAGPGGERTIPVSEVVTGPGQTSLAAGEFLVEFVVDRPGSDTADAYLRFIPRTEMDIAVVGAAARVRVDADGVCQGAQVVLGAVAPTVVPVREADSILTGTKFEEPKLQELAAVAAATANPIDDKRGTKEYRRRVAGVLSKRAVVQAAQRAGAKQR